MPEPRRLETPPRLLLITPPNSYRTIAYLDAARRLGVDVLVASEGKYSLVGAIARGIHVDLDDPAAFEVLLATSRDHPLAGVVATDDNTVELASRIARQLGLPHNPPKAARFSRRKDLARQALAAAHVDVPAFRVIDLDRPLAPQLEGIGLPCVVKPVALSASRGVIRADTLEEVTAACARVRAILAGESREQSFSASHLLVEDFIPGPEVALEGLLHRGKLDVLAIFDKPDPLEGPYFEETYYITPSRHAAGVQRCIVECVTAACAGLGLSEGPIHAEVRVSAEGCVIMEVAARTIGGECARLLSFGAGHDLEELVIAHARGEPLQVQAAAGAAGVLMIPIPGAGVLRRIEGITAARAVPGIEDILINIRDGYELVPLPEGSSYLGFMFARAPTPEQAEAALRAAHAQLTIVVAPLLKLEDGRGGEIAR
ncbi:MAG: ATP-grasp domain-containing protein [Gammaproteobacteria bacterium]